MNTGTRENTLKNAMLNGGMIWGTERPVVRAICTMVYAFLLVGLALLFGASWNRGGGVACIVLLPILGFFGFLVYHGLRDLRNAFREKSRGGASS